MSSWVNFFIVVTLSWQFYDLCPLLQVECIPDKDGRSFCFEISRADGDGWVKGCKTDPNGTVVQASHKSYVFSAETEILRDKWVQTITESIRPNDPDIEQFHRTIEAKKSALRLKNKQQDKHDIPWNRQAQFIKSEWWFKIVRCYLFGFHVKHSHVRKGNFWSLLALLL